MGGGLLSQDDINALLAGSSLDEPAITSNTDTIVASAAAEDTSYNLDNIKKIADHFCEAGKSVLSAIIGQDIVCKIEKIGKLNWSAIKEQLKGQKVFLTTKFTDGFKGDFFVVVDSEFGGVLADLMTGADGSAPPAQLTELHESAINEGINQMIASGLTGISKDLKKISLSTDVPTVKVINIDDSFQISGYENSDFVEILFKFDILNYTDKPVAFLFALNTADSINNVYTSATAPAGATAAAQTAPAATATAAAQSATSQTADSDTQTTAANAVNSQRNMLLLLDVPMVLSVNLGKSKMLLRDILNLGIGSIIELDKSSTEPVDLAIANKPIARGEVVVVDENFGLRLTELVSPLERLELTKKA